MATPGTGNELLSAPGRSGRIGTRPSDRVLHARRPGHRRADARDGDELRALLLSKVLGLNSTQESSLGLFHYADKAGLPSWTSRTYAPCCGGHLRRGQPELKALGGLSSATAGVILRELIAFADQGADVFFGEPEIIWRTAARRPTGAGS